MAEQHRIKQKFAVLRTARRVWVVSSIHGEADHLKRLHRALFERLAPGDRVVYLGNMIGRGAAVRETMDGLLSFRRTFLARPDNFACDIAYLRGGQEEMWQKLLQLQFATDPQAVLQWMLDQGIGPTLEAYGGSIEEGLRQARASTALSLTRWTSSLRTAMQNQPGHYQIMSELRRAAFTDDGTLLFVNTGLDPSRPLETQKDSFWWSGGSFKRITEPYGSFRRVVRGFDPERPGVELGEFTATIDGGCGFGGPLLAACVLPSGEISETLEA